MPFKPRVIRAENVYIIVCIANAYITGARMLWLGKKRIKVGRHKLV